MPYQGKKTIGIGTVKIGSLGTRIKIPQPEKRPISIRQRSFLKKEVLRKNPWWWITHRRGISGRTKVGGDAREKRAISESLVRGTLPERIVYLWLIKANFVPGIDFTFQSSMEGGRIEMGGIVVDFLFEPLKMVLQVQGPTHDTFLRSRKDQEQIGILAQMGYDVEEIVDDIIYDEYRFEDEMRRIFNMRPGPGSGGMAPFIHNSDQWNYDPFFWEPYVEQADRIYQTILGVMREI